jgi:hypothetical protein
VTRIRCVGQRDKAALAGFKAIEQPRPHRDTNETQGRVTDCGGHAPDLAITALTESKLDPGRWDVYAETNRRVARPEYRWVDQSGLGRTGYTILQHDTPAERVYGRPCGKTFDLGQIGLPGLALWRSQTMGKPTIIGQQQQAFAVAIEASCWIKAGFLDVVGQGFPT